MTNNNFSNECVLCGLSKLGLKGKNFRCGCGDLHFCCKKCIPYLKTLKGKKVCLYIKLEDSTIKELNKERKKERRKD